MVDAFENFAVSAVRTAPTPAATGTALVVERTHGARFPAVPFNAVIHPASAPPDPRNAEIVRVTAITGDSLTILRAQDGTTARSILVGDVMDASRLTQQLVEDLADRPYETLIEFVRLGLSASQPAASAVTPGTLYAASDAQAHIKRSDGVVWARYGPTYDELTWTPGIGGTTGASGQSYTTRSGLVTRIGRLVVAAFQVALSVKGTISGDVTVTGLPAAVTPVTRGGAILRFYNLNTNWSEVGASVVIGQTYVLIAGNAGNASSSNATPLTALDITNTTEFRGLLMYFV